MNQTAGLGTSALDTNFKIHQVQESVQILILSSAAMTPHPFPEPLISAQNIRPDFTLLDCLICSVDTWRKTWIDPGLIFAHFRLFFEFFSQSDNEYLFTVTVVKKMKWFLSLTRCHFQPRVTAGHEWLEMTLSVK